MLTRGELDDILREAYAARARGNLTAFGRLFGPDLIFRIVGAGLPAPFCGVKRGCETAIDVLAALDREIEIAGLSVLEIVLDGHYACVFWHAFATSRSSGRGMPLEVLDFIRLSGHGEILELTVFLDSAGLRDLLSAS